MLVKYVYTTLLRTTAADFSDQLMDCLLKLIDDA